MLSLALSNFLCYYCFLVTSVNDILKERRTTTFGANLKRQFLMKDKQHEKGKKKVKFVKNCNNRKNFRLSPAAVVAELLLA